MGVGIYVIPDAQAPTGSRAYAFVTARPAPWR
jgi:hypothetical protein